MIKLTDISDVEIDSITKEIADELAYQHENNENHLTIIKKVE